MKKCEEGFGRSYNPYGLNTPQPQQFQCWGTVIAMVIVLLAMILVYRTMAMQAYVVTEGDGACIFEVRPTGLNGGEELPCGSVETHFSVPEYIYREK